MPSPSRRGGVVVAVAKGPIADPRPLLRATLAWRRSRGDGEVSRPGFAKGSAAALGKRDPSAEVVRRVIEVCSNGEVGQCDPL
jgi:hypothetical protein